MNSILKGHGFSRAAKPQKQTPALAAEGMRVIEGEFPQGLKPKPSFGCMAARLKPCPFKTSNAARAIMCGVFLLLVCSFSQAQRTAWRQATDAELASLLPARAPVEKEHIETEMRTASGIVNTRGHFIAGVVLLTAGYSADGKYSHYLIVQSPIRIGGIALKPGEYAFGWARTQGGDALSVHFHEAATGNLIGTADAHRLAGSSRVESLHIWPPGDKALIQIGRFGIPYELGED
jgi:hypothetical protein